MGEELKDGHKITKKMAKYCIKKKMINHLGKPTHVLMNDGYSEVLEYNDLESAEKFVEIMNFNTDSGWTYEVLTVGK